MSVILQDFKIFGLQALQCKKIIDKFQSILKYWLPHGPPKDLDRTPRCQALADVLLSLSDGDHAVAHLAGAVVLGVLSGVHNAIVC